ncbi:MAG: hypothetical protein Kow00124_25930 [Anaerolineae bacterium]
MRKLSEAEVRDIVAYLQAGEPLPLVYKYLLFPLEHARSELFGTVDAEHQQEERLDGKSHVLVVDDRPENRDLIGSMLEMDGYEAIPAANGLAALDILHSRPVDLVLLDVMMPQMNGYEVLSRIKSNPALRHLPVIMISAIQELDSVVQCIQNGAEDYLFKPINMVLLRARVESSLEKKRLYDLERAYLERLELERERSERLLLNVLPGPIAERLKRNEATIADSFPEVTVLFADIVDFTPLSQRFNPDELVALLNGIFSAFDELTERHGLEKIKTVGDAYMVVGGLPQPRPDHTAAVADLALAMQEAIGEFHTPDGEPFRMRVGMHTGPVVAGVIGSTKFIYDLWGDTVNTASRMEAFGVPGAIQVTEAIYTRLCDAFHMEERGMVEVKGKGAMRTYLLHGRLPA